MTCVAQIRMRARAAQCVVQWSGERLVDCRYHLLGLELVETNAAAADVAFAALEGARHARQRILHDPDIALVLDGAARLPRRVGEGQSEMGPQTRGSMGPNNATVGHPAAAARCVVDVSGPM